MLSPGRSSPFPLPSALGLRVSLDRGYSLATRPCPLCLSVPFPTPSDLGYPGTPYANPGCVPCTVESPSVPSRSAPFAAKRVVKRTDSRVRQMGVRIQPQYFPPCDFKLSPQLSALQSPPQHSGGTDASPGVAAGMCEKARGPRAPGLARGGAGSCSGDPTGLPCACWDSRRPRLRSTLEGHVWFGGSCFGCSRTNTCRGLGTQPLWRGLKMS